MKKMLFALIIILMSHVALAGDFSLLIGIGFPVIIPRPPPPPPVVIYYPTPPQTSVIYYPAPPAPQPVQTIVYTPCPTVIYRTVAYPPPRPTIYVHPRLEIGPSVIIRDHSSYHSHHRR